MEALLALGVRQALPGEFSFRAVRNGKLTITQAQAVADLLGADNDGAVGLALEKLSGTQHELLAALARDLRQLAVLGEAGIDFSDQDLDEVSLPTLRRRTAGIQAPLEKLRLSYDRGSRVQDGVRATFVGLPNAGKSSFFNALLGENRSIVSDEAGTTRDIVRERITLKGKAGSVTLRLEDTAGLRESQSTVERMGIERTHAAVREADLVVLVVDPSQSAEELRAIWRQIGEPASKTIGILTKADLRTGRCAALDEFGLFATVETSSTNGQGVDTATELLIRFSEKWLHRAPREVLLTRLDQRRAVENALAHLARASEAPEIELFAADVRQALSSLGPLIGETLPDDILGKIFSEFCIGK
jgi:tRNA modification GTPase